MIVVFAFAGEAVSVVMQNAASSIKPNLAVWTLADRLVVMVHSLYLFMFWLGNPWPVQPNRVHLFNWNRQNGTTDGVKC